MSDVAGLVGFGLELATAGVRGPAIRTWSGACTVGAAALVADCSVQICGCVPLVRLKPVVTPPTASAATRASAGQPHFAFRNQAFMFFPLVCGVSCVLPQANVAGGHERGMKPG